MGVGVAGGFPRGWERVVRQELAVGRTLLYIWEDRWMTLGEQLFGNKNVWRGDGGVEPDLAACSVLQGQRDASPSSEQRLGATASAHSPQLQDPHVPLSLLDSLGS